MSLLAALSSLPAAATAATTTSAGGVDVERQWQPFPGAPGATTARLAVDTRNRIAYVFSLEAAGPLRVRAWDLDQLTARSPVRAETGTGKISPATPVAVDDRRKTVVLAPEQSASTGVNVPPTVPRVLVYGLRDGRVARLGSPATRFPAGYTVVGLTIDATLGRAFVLAQPYSAGLRAVGAAAGGVQLDVWRLTDLAGGVIGSPLAAPLTVPPACAQVLSTKYPAAVVATADGKQVFFGCSGSRGASRLFGPKPVVDVNGVARLDLGRAAANDQTALQMRPVPGDFGTGETFAAPSLRRLVLIGTSAFGSTARVFDTASGYYVGNVGLVGQTLGGAATSAVSGRGYYVTDGGLGTLDLAGVPVGQGRVYPTLAPLLARAASVETDPVTRRVFVVTGAEFTSKTFVAVLRDRSPAASSGQPRAPEGLDLAERPGLTQSARLADLGAVGAEYRMVGGPTNLLINAATGPAAALVTRAGSRFLQLAVARGVRLTNDQATAEAATASQDSASTADTTSPAGEDASPATPAKCVDLGSGGTSADVDSATAACDVARERVRAAATAEGARMLLARPAVGEPGLVPAPVQVRSARVSADAQRPVKPGPLISVVTAEADGIDILGVVSIGQVQASLRASVRGRRGSASAVYQRSVTGVTVAGRPICAADCPVWQVQQAINDALGGRGRVDFPLPDRQVRPSGTTVDVADSPARHAERVIFDDVPADTVVTPAMEITLYADASTPSRLVVSLAAVSARLLYNIFPVYGDAGGVAGGLPSGLGPAGTTPPADAAAASAGPGPGSPSQQVGAAGSATGAAGLVGLFQRGLKFALRSWRNAASIASLWLLLALPAYLAARRRLLLSLPLLRPQQEFDR